MKKLIITIVLIMSVLGSLVACTKDKKESKGDKLEEFNVVLDWYPNAVHSFIYEAIEKGYYEEEGLKVKILFPSNANDAISLTAAGKADAGIYYLQDIVSAKVNEDIPIMAIGTIVQKPLNVVLSLKEKGINSPKDLIGKKLGYASTPLSEAIIQVMVKADGGEKGSVDVLDVGFDLMSSMTTGNVDATLGCLVNHEVPQMEEEGFEVQYFFPSEYGVPEYYELVFVTGEKQVDEKTEKLEKFLRASKRGFDDMKSDPEQAIATLLSNQNAENFPLTEAVEKKSMDYLLPVMETEDASFLSQDKSVWKKNIDWMFDNGLIDKKIDASEIVADLKY